MRESMEDPERKEWIHPVAATFIEDDMMYVANGGQQTLPSADSLAQITA